MSDSKPTGKYAERATKRSAAKSDDSATSNDRPSRSSASSKKAKKKKHSRDLDVAIFLTLVVISVAVIVAVLLAGPDQGGYSRVEIITLEGIEVPSLSSVVGERRVIEVEDGTVAGALSSKILQYAVEDEGHITGDNLSDYAQFLVNNEGFVPLELGGDTANFVLAKGIDGGRVFEVRAYYTAGVAASINYAITADAEKSDILIRFAQVDALFAEHGLDTAPLLAEAGGLTEQFWGLALSEVMEQSGLGDFLSRFLEIATAD